MNEGKRFKAEELREVTQATKEKADRKRFSGMVGVFDREVDLAKVKAHQGLSQSMFYVRVNNREEFDYLRKLFEDELFTFKYSSTNPAYYDITISW